MVNTLPLSQFPVYLLQARNTTTSDLPDYVDTMCFRLICFLPHNPSDSLIQEKANSSLLEQTLTAMQIIYMLLTFGTYKRQPSPAKQQGVMVNRRDRNSIYLYR